MKNINSYMNLTTNISLGNIIIAVTMLGTGITAWNKIENSVEDFTTLRKVDIERIQKIEGVQDKHSQLIDNVKERISVMDKMSVEMYTDLKHILKNLDEIKTGLKSK